MKLITPFVLFMAIGCILAAGCVTLPDQPAVNATPTPNITVSDLNKTINETAAINETANITPPLKSSLKVSISGLSYPANMSVVLDNETVGVVNPTTALYLLVPEGNHTVMVCESSVCEQENVTTRFGIYARVDFSEKIQQNKKFPNPTAPPAARIVDFYRNGDTISVKVEFFNPSAKDLLMSAEVRCMYNYLDSRTSIKREETARGILEQNVNAGQSIAKWLDLSLNRGYDYNYRSPVIEKLTIK